MSNPFDFDPLAAFQYAPLVPSLPDHEPGQHWGETVAVPLSLDVLAAPLPDESPPDNIARAAAVARSVPDGPVVPVAPIRGASDKHAPPPALPYPFDGFSPLNDAAVARLVLPADGVRAANERTAAALLLVREFKAAHQAPLDLHTAYSLWWLAARKLVDISATLKQPGTSPNTLRAMLVRAAAHDFAAAMNIPIPHRPRVLADAGIPMPTDKKGRYIQDGTGGTFVF